jgi:hypothetical protein
MTALRTLVVTAAGALAVCAVAFAQGSVPAGFTPIFNGRDLAGWHISASSPHGRTPDWRVSNGILAGRQRPPGSGGILLTDNRTYRDVEVVLELQADFGCDGGLFLRSDEQGRAYQVMIDNLPGGTVGGVYGEGLENVATSSPPDWKRYWREGQWNTLRARIEGAVPRIRVWLNERQITDWTDTANHLPGGADAGMIGLQVHGGGDRWKQGGMHRFRLVAVRVLP